MIDITWDSSITKDPLQLADGIELAVAFVGRYGSRFTQANFQRSVDTENLDDTEDSFLDSDGAYERNEQFEQALALIADRASWLGRAYPFKVESGEVQFAPPESLEDCLPYLFLLVCSNSNYAPSLKNGLPIDFEYLCKEAFRALFPQRAEVLLFSKNSQDRREIFGSSAGDAVRMLAQMLNTGLVNSERLPDTQREFGIDLIATYSFDDQAPYTFFAFAQCTIGEEWWLKKHEAIADNGLADFIHLNARHSNFLMIPHFPRYNLREWSEDPARTGNCILCDRFRICKLLQRADSFDPSSPPESIAEVFKQLRDNLVEPV